MFPPGAEAIQNWNFALFWSQTWRWKGPITGWHLRLFKNVILLLIHMISAQVLFGLENSLARVCRVKKGKCYRKLSSTRDRARKNTQLGFHVTFLSLSNIIFEYYRIIRTIGNFELLTKRRHLILIKRRRHFGRFSCSWNNCLMQKRNIN